jgi:CubicO group peptidase (beta-lactamase class C family)
MTFSALKKHLEQPVAVVPEAKIIGDEPGRGGYRPSQIHGLERCLDRVYASGAYPGFTVCVRKGNQVVINRAYGHARGNAPQDPKGSEKVPMQVDTPICLFSASKAVTAVLMHQLAAEGLVNLDLPIAHYLPSFAAHGKGKITVAQMLAHRGGVPMIDLPKGELKADLLLQWDYVVKVLCEGKPQRMNKLSYHAVTGGFLLAEILQKVTGDSINAYLDSRIRKPMNMRFFSYGLDKADRPLAAQNAVSGMKVLWPISAFAEEALGVNFDEVVAISNTDVFFDAVIPAGNLYATAEELSRFYQMLLNGGTWQGKTILHPEAVRRAVKPLPLGFDWSLKIPMRYSEGLMLGMKPFSLFGPNNPEAYGHLGFMNILGWADPERELAVAFLPTGKAILGTHIVPMVDMLNRINVRA